MQFSELVETVPRQVARRLHRLNTLKPPVAVLNHKSKWQFVFFLGKVRYKLGLSDDEEDEEDSGEQPRSDQDLCHPLCQCDKCNKWQRVSHSRNQSCEIERTRIAFTANVRFLFMFS